MFQLHTYRHAIPRLALVGAFVVSSFVAAPVGAMETTASISVTKTVNGSTFKHGEQPVYTIVVRNTGDVNLTNGTVTDTLPAGLTPPVGVSVLRDSGVTGTLGLPPTLLTNLALAPGSAATITLTPTVDVNAVVGTQITNTVLVSLPQVLGVIQSQAVFTVGADSIGTNPAIAVTKTVSGATFKRGERPVYTIVVCNTGDTVLSGGTISDTLPAEFIAPITARIDFTSGATGVTGTLPTLLSNVALPIGSAITVTLTPTLGSGAVTSASITNTVVVSLPLLTGPVSATATFVVAVTRDKFNYLPVTRRD